MQAMGPQPFMWRLRRLICNNCALSGPLPANWQNMDELRDIALVQNNLTGMSFFGARRLRSLRLDDNPLSTNLEPMLGWAWPTMQVLSLSRCRITGTLPTGWCCPLLSDTLT